MAELSTAGFRGAERSAEWSRIIAKTYFPLQLDFKDPDRFTGRLSHRTFGNVALSRLTSDPASYKREASHISEGLEEDYLVTIPRCTAVEFRQLGRDMRCAPGGFIIQRGDEPYRFRYEQTNDLIVLKLSKKELVTRVSDPDGLCARVFDATTGTQQVFAAMVNMAQNSDAGLDAPAQRLLGSQLLAFLALAINNEKHDTSEAISAVRAAHLARIDQFIRKNIKVADLSPERIAASCGISKRYLHDLFRSVDKSVAQQVRDYRLAQAQIDLRTRSSESLATVAYRYSFADQAQFSRLFREKFGVTPSAYRAGARA
jgi:AraC-like DNA-binding protein